MARRRRPRWLVPVSVAVAAVATGAVVLVATRAFAGTRAPWSPPAPGEVPLRPPPSGSPPGTAITGTSPIVVPMGPPGPLASELAAWVDDQDDEELEAARAAMPAHWWELILLATQMPNDHQVVIVLNPLIVDAMLMSQEQQSQLQSDLVSAVGVVDALELKSIFDDAQQRLA